MSTQPSPGRMGTGISTRGQRSYGNTIYTKGQRLYVNGDIYEGAKVVWEHNIYQGSKVVWERGYLRGKGRMGTLYSLIFVWWKCDTKIKTTNISLHNMFYVTILT